MKYLTLSIVVSVLVSVLQGQGQEVKELDQYQEQYRRGIEKLELAFREKRLAMPAAQVQALRKLESDYQRAGDLQGMLAVQRERKRFVVDPRGASVPTLQSPPELAKLMRAYKARFAEAAVERDFAVSGLNRRYQEVLKALQVKLTQQGRIEDATKVMKTIASLGNVKTETVRQPTATAAPAAPAAAASGGESSAVGDDFFDSWFE